MTKFIDLLEQGLNHHFGTAYNDINPFNEHSMQQNFHPRKHSSFFDTMQIVNEIECNNEEEAKEKRRAFRDLVDKDEFIFVRGKYLVIAKLKENQNSQFIASRRTSYKSPSPYNNPYKNPHKR